MQALASGGGGKACTLGGGAGAVGPAVPFRALSGRLKCPIRRHKFNEDSLSVERGFDLRVRRVGRRRYPLEHGPCLVEAVFRAKRVFLKNAGGVGPWRGEGSQVQWSTGS